MNRIKERIKNTLICVLLLGMVYFTYKVWFFDSPFGEISILSFFETGGTGHVIYEGTGSDLETFGIRPVGISVRDGKGHRGAIYESGAAESLYRALRDDIADVFGKAGDGVSVPDDEWKEALSGKGIFMDYFGNLPVDSLRLWFGAESGEDITNARYIMLDADGENVTVYAKNDVSGLIMRYASSYESKRLTEKTETITAAKAVSFAFERSEEDFRSIGDETLIMENRAKIPEITAGNAFESFKNDAESACLSAFKLRDVTSGTYSEQDGTKVYVADMVTLKISPSGIASYTDSRDRADETIGIGVESEAKESTLAEKTETARNLATSVAAALPGKGGIYIESITESSTATEIVFGRMVNGIPVKMLETSYFMKVRIEDEMVKSARINLRYYESTPAGYDMLPERIAAAAVKGSNKKGSLRLAYSDTGEGKALPGWYVGGETDERGEGADGVVEG